MQSARTPCVFAKKPGHTDRMLSTFPDPLEAEVLGAIEEWDKDALRVALQFYKGEPGKLGEAMQWVFMTYTTICNNNATHSDQQCLNDAFRMFHILWSVPQSWSQIITA